MCFKKCFIYLQSKTKQIDMKTKLQQYIFTFEQGGWNTVWATNKRSALSKAKNEWNSISLTVREDSLRKATQDGLETAMSTFY